MFPLVRFFFALRRVKMLVNEKFLLLQPVQLDPEINSPLFQWRGKRALSKSQPQVGCDLLWCGRGLVYNTSSKRMPVLRFAYEIPRAEEKPGVTSQNMRLVSICGSVVSVSVPWDSSLRPACGLSHSSIFKSSS